MAVADAFWYYSCISPGTWPGIGFVSWFDLLGRASVARAGTCMGSGALRRLFSRPTRGDTITNHGNLLPTVMPDGYVEAGAGFTIERFTGQAKRVGYCIGVQKTPDRLPDPR